MNKSKDIIIFLFVVCFNFLSKAISTNENYTIIKEYFDNALHHQYYTFNSDSVNKNISNAINMANIQKNQRLVSFINSSQYLFLSINDLTADKNKILGALNLASNIDQKDAVLNSLIFLSYYSAHIGKEQLSLKYFTLASNYQRTHKLNDYYLFSLQLNLKNLYTLPQNDLKISKQIIDNKFKSIINDRDFSNVAKDILKAEIEYFNTSTIVDENNKYNSLVSLNEKFKAEGINKIRVNVLKDLTLLSLKISKHEDFFKYYNELEDIIPQNMNYLLYLIQIEEAKFLEENDKAINLSLEILNNTKNNPLSFKEKQELVSFLINQYINSNQTSKVNYWSNYIKNLKKENDKSLNDEFEGIKNIVHDTNSFILSNEMFYGTIIIGLLLAILILSKYHHKLKNIFTSSPKSTPYTVQLNSDLKNRLNILFEEFIKKEEYLSSDITIDLIAKSFGTNSKYINLFIQTKYKMTFSEYINYNRILYAKELIDSGRYAKLSLQGFSERVGYKSINSLKANFLKINNENLSDYIRKVEQLEHTA